MAQLPEPPCSRSAVMPDYEIRYAGAADQPQWDEYVRNHAHTSPFHAFGWGNAIRKAYGHATYNLMLLAGGAGPDSAPPDAGPARRSATRVAGVLPVVHLTHALFGNCLVSMPFADAGGILADCPEGEARLLAEAVRLGHQTGAASIELRHERLLQSCEDASIALLRNADSRKPLQAATRTHKVRMLLNLPASSEILMKSFKSKLRSQINKALKEDFSSRTGGPELLEDFYDVFAVNMRDLGSPVHSAQLMRHCLVEFPEHARIIGSVVAACRCRLGRRRRQGIAQSVGLLSAQVRIVGRQHASVPAPAAACLRSRLPRIRLRTLHAGRRHLQVQGAVGRGARAALLALHLAGRIGARSGSPGQSQVCVGNALLAEAARGGHETRRASYQKAHQPVGCLGVQPSSCA
jgi:hypothetical protein